MIAKLSNDVAHYYHQDALGSVRLVTSPAVEITFSSNYVPFGTSVNTTGVEAFMYTGKPVDDVTGLYYFGARFYDPSIFRFITQDRNVGHIDDPISMNRYIYARDNPLAFKDKNGCETSYAMSDQQWQALAFCAVAVMAAFAVVATCGMATFALPLVFGAVSATISTASDWEDATPTKAAFAYSIGVASSLFGILGSCIATDIVGAQVSGVIIDEALGYVIGGTAFVGPSSAGLSIVNDVANGNEINVNEALFTYATNAITFGAGGYIYIKYSQATTFSQTIYSTCTPTNEYAIQKATELAAISYIGMTVTQNVIYSTEHNYAPTPLGGLKYI
jgi:RHS repeat-associated protein